MESVVMLPANGLEAAEQIIDVGEERGVTLRLLGGLAFKLNCPSSNRGIFFRENKDIDLVGRRDDSRKIVKIMETLGYKPRDIFNKLNMGRRFIFYDMGNKRRVDIFLDEFEMCHKFNFKNSLLPNTYTLPITELVMTKLQVVEMTEKEHLDLIAAFRDFDLAGENRGIDGEKIAELCSKDWGLFTTFSKSLDSVRDRAVSLGRDDRDIVLPRILGLKKLMEDRPKTLSWRVRARIGEKAKWYELPDSDGDAVFA